MQRADDQPGMREFLDFLRLISKQLMECGSSSNRVELLTQKLGHSWGYEVETLAIPTGVWISVRRGHYNLIELTRIRSWSIDLDRLARLNDLVELIHAHRISIDEAHDRLAADAQQKPPYSRWLTLAAGAVASPILVWNYGGPTLEVALALPLGILIQLLNKYIFVGEQRYLGDFLSAAIVALYACLMREIWPWVDVPRLVVGGLIVLVPGLVMVNAVHELAQKNLVSGAAKLLEAMMITVSLGCGVIFVLGLALLFQ
jgi:uncharacterized membrane protein YjjP (DUF1212 family)